MAVTARRTVAKVKSSAMMPRQPEVPNLMGEAAVFGEALMRRYSTRSAIVLKDERGRERGGALRSPLLCEAQRPLRPFTLSLEGCVIFQSSFNTEVTENS